MALFFWLEKVIVYCARNKINGKEYIGLTTNDMKDRKYQHEVDKSKDVFHLAISEFGKDSFEWFELQRYDSLEELRLGEIFWVKNRNTISPLGYNSIMPTFYPENSFKIDKEIINSNEYREMCFVMKKDCPLYATPIVDLENSKIWPSISDFSKQSGKHVSNIIAMARGKRRKLIGTNSIIRIAPIGIGGSPISVEISRISNIFSCSFTFSDLSVTKKEYMLR